MFFSQEKSSESLIFALAFFNKFICNLELKKYDILEKVVKIKRYIQVFIRCWIAN